MVAPTTKLLTPHLFIINNGTKELSYPIAMNRNHVRQWRKTKVRIQPGEGELIKHWDSWHSGMGWSRDESRDAPYAPPVYDTSTGVTATRRGYLYPQLSLSSVTADGPGTINRFADMGGYTYAFGTSTSTTITVTKIDPADFSLVYVRTFSGWTAPAGQTTEFGGYLYVPSAGGVFKELTTVCGDLTAAFLYNGSTFTNNTANANTIVGTAFTLLGDNADDIFYWGCATKFDGIYINIVTGANTPLTLDWEYSKGGGVWADIEGPETDGTSGFTTGAWVTWASASQTDWATDTVNGVTGYFVRVKTATAFTTNPTADWTPPSDVWTDGPDTHPDHRRAWHMGTAGKLLWRVGDNSDTAKHYVVNSCATAPLTAANWSDPADYVIGKPGRNINSIAELGRWPYFGKEEGLFGADTEGNQTNALDFTRNLIASTNCSDTIRWLGTLVTVHKSGLWQHTGVSSRLIGIETLESNMSGIKGGRYIGLATVGQWLCVSYLVGSTYWILAGRPGHEDEPGVVWHPLLSSATVAINAPFGSGINTNPCLWLGNYGSFIYYVVLAQDGSPDPTDANITFTASEVTLDLPGVDWGMPGTPKHGHMVEIVTTQVKGTGGTVKVYYGWDGATPSTQLGSTITTATRTQCFWAGGNTQGTHWGYRPQIRIGVTGHATNVLRVDKVSLYCAARPRKEPVITTVVRCGDNLDRLRDAKTMYDDLEALENAGVYAVRDPDDPASGTFYAVVENVDEYKGEQIADATGERLVTVTLRVIKYA